MTVLTLYERDNVQVTARVGQNVNHNRDSVKRGCGRRMRMADGGRDSYKKKIRNK